MKQTFCAPEKDIPFMPRDIELKYISTPAGNVASHETVTELAEILESFSQTNTAEHEEIRGKIDLINGILDQLAQLSEQIAKVLESQTSANEKLDDILEQISRTSKSLKTDTKRTTADQK